MRANRLFERCSRRGHLAPSGATSPTENRVLARVVGRDLPTGFPSLLAGGPGLVDELVFINLEPSTLRRPMGEEAQDPEHTGPDSVEQIAQIDQPLIDLLGLRCRDVFAEVVSV